ESGPGLGVVHAPQQVATGARVVIDTDAQCAACHIRYPLGRVVSASAARASDASVVQARSSFGADPSARGGTCGGGSKGVLTSGRSSGAYLRSGSRSACSSIPACWIGALPNAGVTASMNCRLLTPSMP